MTTTARATEDVIGCAIDVLSWEQAVRRVLRWATQRESRYVCHCNVHAVVTARRDPRFRYVLSHADLATPDGMPIAWVLRGLGHTNQPRIDGPDLMWKLCAAAARDGQRVYFYGGTVDTVTKLVQRLTTAFSELVVVGAESPPFTDHATQVDRGAVARINQSRAQLVFVGLGCPKQEYWMRLHRDHVQAVMIGVGAAFDYHAGTLRRAPSWLRQLGLEWAYRLAAEPRRLLRRYAVTNSLFLWYLTRQLCKRMLQRMRTPIAHP